MRGGEETSSLEWQGAYVVIDPTHHDDGQKMSIENDIVGSPLLLTNALFAYLNEDPNAPFTIVPEPLFDSSTFWSFADKNAGVLRSVRFEFVVPNMFGITTNMDADLKEAGEDTGSDRVTLAFSAIKGIFARSKRILQAVAYAERGGGKIKATSLDGDTYNSDRKLKTAKISVDELNTGPKADKPNIDALNRLLGRP